MATYLDAGEYETLMRRYEIAGIKEPRQLGSIRGEGTMAYAMAQQRLGLKHTAEEVHGALDTFLKRNVDTWLGTGHSDTVARWMKIAFWQPPDDPIAMLLRCYDYLPELDRPEYPQRIAASDH
ncbi:MAG TPA: hypothetical protein VHV08_03885 [Pirellulales bacterium]|nr:hypothetical protein [Pirellulales bacterium]